MPVAVTLFPSVYGVSMAKMLHNALKLGFPCHLCFPGYYVYSPKFRGISVCHLFDALVAFT